MASDAAEPAKALLPYLQRADELQKHEPLVAYYCRLYAMERGLVIPQKDRTKTTNSLLISLMNQLEKDKKTLKLSSDDNLYLEGFASNVFAKADKIDRAGRADLNTAKTFYAASIFYEIINQFGELPAELEQKQKYAAWKAADIRKAIKEGRKPEPGPPGSEKDEKMPSLSPSNSLDLGRSQSFSTIQHGSSIDTPPAQQFDSPSPAKDLDRRQSFSSSYNTPPTDHTPTHYTPDKSPTQHTQTTRYTPENLPTQHTPTHYTPENPPTQHTPTHYTPENLPTQHTSTHYTPENPPTQHTPTHYTPPPYTVPSNSNSNSNSNYPSNSSTDPSNYPQNYPTEQTFYPTNPSNYPNFQSYPSFQDTTVPSVPTHQPSFSYPDSPSQFQNVFANQQPPAVQTIPTVPTVPPPVQRAEPVPVAENYRYDSSYQPSVEKISEAHKAARFAVGALAFDDVVVAVDHLKRALDLLTNPSAKTH